MFRYRVRAHTELSGSDRWAYLVDYAETPLGLLAEWSLDSAQAAECDGFNLPGGGVLLDPTPDQVERGRLELRDFFEREGLVWGLELEPLES